MFGSGSDLHPSKKFGFGSGKKEMIFPDPYKIRIRNQMTTFLLESDQNKILPQLLLQIFPTLQSEDLLKMGRDQFMMIRPASSLLTRISLGCLQRYITAFPIPDSFSRDWSSIRSVSSSFSNSLEHKRKNRVNTQRQQQFKQLLRTSEEKQSQSAASEAFIDWQV